ncbi:SOUL heme-binding domain containing protein [Nitzschia inconspicua]|uniref:SOUL heme-binding domain containing protein n=1 Tax=Nitzschia inconspicua TaxID=303405 RepID=A0A9K3LF92_9STRA|nr:SOUL heme-binding domain containing protein [Nitzschia inconspicua]
MLGRLFLLLFASTLTLPGHSFRCVSAGWHEKRQATSTIDTDRVSTSSPRRERKNSPLKASSEGVKDCVPSGDRRLVHTSQLNLNELLQDATNQNATKASLAILSALQEFRAPAQEQEHVLNRLLEDGPDASLPFWARFRPLAKFSRRARMYSLRRALDIVSPPVSSNSLTNENVLARRRRALISLLRSLSTEELEEGGRPAIVVLEKKARQASTDSGTDLISRRPQDLETPDYEVLATGDELLGKKKGLSIEIRRYKPYSVCSVPMNKPRPDDSTKTDAKLRAPELKGASSFGALAGYLFGKNQQSTAMKMTTPVFTTGLPEEVGEGTENYGREMQFVLPSEYWGDENLQKAPAPLDGSGVILRNNESEDRAVLMFSGYASTKSSRERLHQLLSSLSAKDSKWKVIPNTERIAQYNDPFTPPWRRLNEVSVQVEAR